MIDATSNIRDGRKRIGCPQRARGGWLPTLALLALSVCCVGRAQAQRPDIHMGAGPGHRVQPALTERDSVLLAAWFVYRRDTVGILARVDIGDSVRCSAADSVALYVNIWRYGNRYPGYAVAVARGLSASGGDAVVYAYSDVVYEGLAVKEHSVLAVFPVAGRWVNAHLVDGSIDPLAIFTYAGSHRDPVSGISIHSAYQYNGQAGSRIEYVAVSNAGVVQRHLSIPMIVDSASRDPVPEPHVLPLSGRSVIVLSAVHGAVYRDSTRVRFVRWEGPPIRDARYQRLRGDGILRWYAPDSTTIVLTIFDTTLAKRREAAVVLPTFLRTANTMVVEDPFDGSFVAVAATPQGIVAQRISASLETVGPIIPISAERSAAALPSALIRHDSLFVAWQDRRSGTDDVYLNVAQLRTPAGVEGPSAPAVGVIRVLPTPARDECMVNIGSACADGAGLVVVDALGRVVLCRDLERGVDRVSLNTSELAAGLYSIVIRGRPAMIGRLVVAR